MRGWLTCGKYTTVYSKSQGLKHRWHPRLLFCQRFLHLVSLLWDEGGVEAGCDDGIGAALPGSRLSNDFHRVVHIVRVLACIGPAGQGDAGTQRME